MNTIQKIAVDIGIILSLGGAYQASSQTVTPAAPTAVVATKDSLPPATKPKVTGDIGYLASEK